MNTPFSAVWRERRISPLLLFARCALCRSSRRRLFDRLRYRLHTDKLDGVAVCQNALLDLELRQGCQEFVQALGAEVAHVKVRVALDELVSHAGGSHPAGAIVHLVDHIADQAADGIAVDGGIVPRANLGGGFGGKEDVSVQHLAVLAALRVNRPVKAKLTRQESINFHPKRHYMEGTFTLGCDENGIFTGLDCEIHFDTGAYASLCGPVLERACTHSVGPYCYQNTDIRGFGWYTNNPPAGAFRGFGVCQSEFALESNINLLAEKVGISPWEIRFRNAIEPGKALPNGQIADCSTALKETLLEVKDAYYAHPGHAGIACAMKNAGVGVGIPDTGRCRLVVEDGKLHIFAGASCIGQGLGTVLTQMVYEQTGIPRDRIVYERSNTYCAPDSGTTSGSRQTLFTGEAVRRACQDLKEAMGASGGLDALNGQEFYGEYLGKTDPLGAPVPNPVSHVAYGYATQVCILDDEGKIRQMVAAHDVGKAVNPLSIEGQIEGGVVMSMGFALTERYPLTDCRPTAKYGTLGLFRANQIPEITPIIVEKAGLNVACGAIGIGEITSIPTAPAIADAYYRYDGEFRTSLPLKNTPYAKK